MPPNLLGLTLKAVHRRLCYLGSKQNKLEEKSNTIYNLSAAYLSSSPSSVAQLLISAAITIVLVHHSTNCI